MTSVRLVGDLDPVFAWDGRVLYATDRLRPPHPAPLDLRGAAACVLPSDDGSAHRLLRDPLGLNKLFWARDADGSVVVASRPYRLIAEGHALGAIRALPRGAVVDLPGDGEPSRTSLVPEAWHAAPDGSAPTDLATVSRRIAVRLHGYMAVLAAALPRTRVYVCLSGGLDSTGVAVLAREHFSDLVGVSFDLERAGGRPSEDRTTAQRLSRDLGIPLLEVTVSADALLEHLDTVLLEGVDWRGFNVHAGLVNAALAQAIAAEAGGGEAVLVLTGDLANEFLVDYHAEEHGGTVHYALPDLPPAALRTMLVRGLDTSNREIGVFAAWGLALVQPYAAAVDEFLSVPVDVLALPDAKQRLAREMFGERVPRYVYDRPKTRAQVGGTGADGGVLGVCVDRGIDDRALRARFAALHEVSDEAEIGRFIRTGMYRAATP